jgi:hypothetical protein
MTAYPSKYKEAFAAAPSLFEIQSLACFALAFFLGPTPIPRIFSAFEVSSHPQFNYRKDKTQR